MARNALFTDLAREIKKSRSRFLSIMAIVGLGVAFFVGIKSAGPDMQATADRYFDEQRLHDIRIMSTMGITTSDLVELGKLPLVKEVMPGFSTDAKAGNGQNTMVLKLHSMPIADGAARLDDLVLLEGAFPKAATECVVENNVVNQLGLSIGDMIEFDEGVEDGLLKETELRIVGIVKSPEYISMERGTSSLGTGSADGYAYLPNEAFEGGVYTLVNISVWGAEELNCFSPAYEALIDEAVLQIEDVAGRRERARLDDVRTRASVLVSQAESLLNASRDQADAQIREASETLALSLQELLSGQQELEEQNRVFLDKMRSGEKEIEQNQLLINRGELELSAAENEFYGKTKPQAEKALEEAIATLDNSRAQLELFQTALGAFGTYMNSIGWQPSLSAQDIREMQRLLELAQQNYPGTIPGELKELADALASMDAERIEEQFAQIDWRAIFRRLERELSEGFKQLEAGYNEVYLQRQQLAEAEALLKQKRSELENSKKLLAAARAELASGRALGQQQIVEARAKLSQGWAAYNRGVQQLFDQDMDLARQFMEMEKEIRKAYDELERLKEPTWYVLDRNANYGYADYEQNTRRIDAIGQVFPVLFFLVAALVSLTSMTRMVEEGRTQTGVLKALGYEGKHVAYKYVLYALYACLAGTAVGLVAGFTALPWVIYSAYNLSLYELPDVWLQFVPSLAVQAVLAGAACTAGAAVLVVRNQMHMVPANLMRPKTPRAGKRIIFERIGPLWRRLSYSHKVTVRNLFRYKKRFYMTVIGIAGCTALLLTGFGLRDSILGMVGWQFGDIYEYNLSVVWSTPATAAKVNNIEYLITRNESYTGMAKVQTKSVQLSTNGEKRDATLMAVGDVPSFKTQVNLQTRGRRDKIELSDDGCVLTEKIARLLGVSKGERVQVILTDADGVERPYSMLVTGITENYVGHTIYMNRNVYEKILGQTYTPNQLLCSFSATDEAFETELSTKLMEVEGVLSASFNTGLADYFSDMMTSLNAVIVIIIGAAAALAFIVLYNLSNINVTERERELATIKVLGFFDMEVTQYISRENTVLTAVGTGVGLLLGIALHRYLVTTVEVDMVMFGRNIDFLSYLWSVILTFGFSYIVTIVMHFKLKKINMIEALKSVE